MFIRLSTLRLITHVTEVASFPDIPTIQSLISMLIALSFLQFCILHGNNKTGWWGGLGTRLLYIHVRYHWYVSVSTVGILYSRSCLCLGVCVVANNLKEWMCLCQHTCLGSTLVYRRLYFLLFCLVSLFSEVHSVIPNCSCPHCLQCAMKSGGVEGWEWG